MGAYGDGRGGMSGGDERGVRLHLLLQPPRGEVAPTALVGKRRLEALGPLLAARLGGADDGTGHKQLNHLDLKLLGSIVFLMTLVL